MFSEKRNRTAFSPVETGSREEGEETSFSLVHTFGGSCHFPSLPPFFFPVTKMMSCRRHVCICRILSASVFLNMKCFTFLRNPHALYNIFAVLWGALGFKKRGGEIDSLLWDIFGNSLPLFIRRQAYSSFSIKRLGHGRLSEVQWWWQYIFLQ